ncbi:MAG: hypothetical protein ACJ8AT_23980 [Hyalangium sp.]|uniref:hypothetical protein n=1 Tax=Hyalangium sp. TaxID=2028555 RepID=UPI00389A8C12
MKLRHVMATLAATLLTTSPALAQSPAPIPSFQLERMELNPSGAGSLLVGTGEVPSAGTLRLSVLEYPEQAPLTFSRGEAGRSGVIKSWLTTQVLAAWSATDRLEFALQLPLIASQDAVDLNHLGISSPSSSGLSTARVHARLGLLEKREGSPVDLALDLGTGLPLGGNQSLARDEGLRFTPELMAGDAFGWVRVGLEVGLLLQPHIILSPQATAVRDEMGDELRFGASLSTTNTGLRGEVAVRGALPLVRSPASGEVFAGARYAMAHGWEVFALGGMGLGNNPGTPKFRAMAGISFGSTGDDQSWDGHRRTEISLVSIQHSREDSPSAKVALR